MLNSTNLRRQLAWLWLACTACQGDAASSASPADARTILPPTAAGFDSHTPPPLCEREAADAVRDIFCAADSSELAVTGLRELANRLMIRALGVNVDEAQAQAIELDPHELIDNCVVLGHSTALSGHLVSPINPRALLFNYRTFIAFQRGAQKVEIATIDRNTFRLNMYLLRFQQDCNARTEGCNAGDLYTPRIESDWRKLELRDDEELKNTAFDCRLCHQRGLERPTLLMRELRGPWTHFFAIDSGAEKADFSGGKLMRDYTAAKGKESYAGLPADALRHTAGGILQNRVEEAQPIEFDAPTIEAELLAGAERSPTWDQAFAAFRRGDQLALPYFALRATDPDKQARLTDAYTRYRAGELEASELPDLSDIHPDDPQVRAEIGLQVEPNATPAQALIQACGPCHNDVLDQTLSRARFNIALTRMSRAELDLAIDRIQRQALDPSVMPPHGMRELDPGGRDRVIEYLRASKRSVEDDAMLENAARVGMAKPRPEYPRF